METNKHGVNYSEIQVGDLVQIAFDGDLNDTCLGYVTKVYDNKLVAIWSDDFEEYKEYFSKGNIIGHWKVVDFRKVPTKPYKQLVAYYNRNEERTIWGIYTKTENGKVYAHWNIGYQYHTGDIHMPADRITNVEDILIHEEKSKDFTFSDFDASVKRTWKDQDFKDAVSNAALGLTGEAGEVADLIKKAVYHGRGFHNVEDGDPEFSGMIYEQEVLDELSDVLYYVDAMAQEFGYGLEDVAKHNKEKLEKRFPEGFSTEDSAQKADRNTVEVKPDGEIILEYSEFYKEDTLQYKVDGAPFEKTYFSTDYDLKNTLKELRDGKRVTIEDRHAGEFTFTKVGDLLRVQFKDLENQLDSHTCLVRVSHGEVQK
ncbi:nucleoside triphosphate pyrophosphohydrolase family protein [Bacillus wiedmannii]|uniref:nucleoside triphosphate pyrophosphohydrolase family protein n=1 Tax=Bacillus wiedmannii TaxID=1890302 RepID=UPI0015CF6083|nr:nucleoside triphosphate pyrophosphohydrolase family protein [Bacillus wiedmannii]